MIVKDAEKPLFCPECRKAVEYIPIEPIRWESGKPFINRWKCPDCGYIARWLVNEAVKKVATLFSGQSDIKIIKGVKDNV